MVFGTRQFIIRSSLISACTCTIMWNKMNHSSSQTGQHYGQMEDHLLRTATSVNWNRLKLKLIVFVILTMFLTTVSIFVLWLWVNSKKNERGDTILRLYRARTNYWGLWRRKSSIDCEIKTLQMNWGRELGREIRINLNEFEDFPLKSVADLIVIQLGGCKLLIFRHFVSAMGMSHVESHHLWI